MVVFLFHLKMAFLKVKTTIIRVFSDDSMPFQTHGSKVSDWNCILHIIMVILVVIFEGDRMNIKRDVGC